MLLKRFGKPKYRNMLPCRGMMHALFVLLTLMTKVTYLLYHAISTIISIPSALNSGSNRIPVVLSAGRNSQSKTLQTLSKSSKEWLRIR